jgi:8-oxo-dGTP pyrophosphatase MutT (NUDIX family)
MKMVKRYSGVLVKHNDEVLMCKRNNKGTLPGVWSIPAGGIDNGETPYNAAIREFYEETNIKIDNDINFIGILTRTNRSGKKIKGLLYVFLMESDEKIIPDLKNAKDGDEHIGCSYFNRETLPNEDENDQLCKLILKILAKK